MKKNYKRKLRAERAMVKAFGLEHTSSMMTYNDVNGVNAGINGGPATVGAYMNMAFDSNSLLPIPGTNLYAYEGSNPMWLKKYEKVDSNSKNVSSASVTSSSLPSTSSSSDNSGGGHRENKKHRGGDKKSALKSQDDDITSFYLKQIDSTLDSSSPLKLLSEKPPISDIMIKHNSVIDELSSINFLDTHNSNTTQPSHLTSFQRETLLTFATDDTLINNAITAAINNCNQTMKSFKKPMPQNDVIDGYKTANNSNNK